MNAQQMSTEELLAKAEARPWIASGNQLRTTKQIAVATMIYAGNEGTQANTELIRRAVNSFEAMREKLDYLTRYPLAMNNPGFADEVSAVLAIAEGK